MQLNSNPVVHSITIAKKAICKSASDKLDKLEKLRAAGKGASPEAQALAIELRDDLEAISNRVNQCATKQSGDLPTQAGVEQFRDNFQNSENSNRTYRLDL